MFLIFKDVCKIDYYNPLMKPLLKRRNELKSGHVYEIADDLAHWLIKQGLAVGPAKPRVNPVVIPDRPDVVKIQREMDNAKKADPEDGLKEIELPETPKLPETSELSAAPEAKIDKRTKAYKDSIKE